MSKEPLQQIPMPEAQVPAGTYRLLERVEVLGNTSTKRYVSVDNFKPNVLAVMVVVKDGRQSHPQNRYFFNIDNDELVTVLTGKRELHRGRRDRDIPIAPKFEDVLSVVIEAYRRQTKLRRH